MKLFSAIMNFGILFVSWAPRESTIIIVLSPTFEVNVDLHIIARYSPAYISIINVSAVSKQGNFQRCFMTFITISLSAFKSKVLTARIVFFLLIETELISFVCEHKLRVTDP